MMRKSIALFLIAAVQAAGPAAAAGAAVSLRIDGREIPLSASVQARLAHLARETMKLCGPNTRQHPHNFGGSALLASLRHERLLQASRLHVVYDRPFQTVSHLGGTL